MTKPKTVLIVVQEGGSTGEFYAHAFTRQRYAARFRRSCGKASYRTTGPVRVHADTDIDALQAVLDAVGDELT